MYLQLLDESQKMGFLKLAVALATVDGDYSDEERNLVDSYCKEMNMFHFEVEVEPVETIIEEYFNDATNDIKRIVLFEATGLVMCDGKFDQKEKKIIDYMENTFSLSEGFADSCIEIVNRYLDFQNQLDNLILQ